MLKLICLLFTVTTVYATGAAPQDFSIADRNFVFMDMQSADYDLEFDITRKHTSAISKIVFTTTNEGLPLFDLVPEPQKITLNGKEVSAITVELPGGGKMRALDRKLSPGSYNMEIHNTFNENVDYTTWFAQEVRAAFWMSDLDDRNFLELYLPSNLEFDQLKISISARVIGAQKDHVIKSNGVVQARGSNEFRIEYPEYYTASSLYFHLYPKGAFLEKAFVLTSSNGRKIRAQVYAKHQSTLDAAVKEATAVFHELERDYGPWPHPHLIIYCNGHSGMEYAGATQTGLSVLGHELHHSYFARGMTPGRGNDGWIDEALASWRDEGHRPSAESDLSQTRMAGHSPYRRHTDDDAYGAGERFIGHLDQRFKASGGMLPFLKSFVAKFMYQINTTARFQEALEEHFDADLKGLFQRYVYETQGLGQRKADAQKLHPAHQRLSKREKLDLL